MKKIRKYVLQSVIRDRQILMQLLHRILKKVAAIQAVIDQSKYGTLQRVGNSYWDACKSFADTILSGNTGGLSEQELMDVLVDGITASTVK